MLVGEDAHSGVEASISVASITESHFGALLARDGGRAPRVDRLAAVKATFDPLPVTVNLARTWENPAAAVVHQGGKPSRRQIDLAIAAMAAVEHVTLLACNVADFGLIGDMVDARQP